MAITVTSDIMDRGGVEETSDGGMNITRAFLVEGVDGNAAGRHVAALSASGIPQLYEVHPYSTGMFCLSRSVQPVKDSPMKFIVICAYKAIPPDQAQPQYAQISVGGSVQQEETNKDKDGKVIIIPAWKENDNRVNGNPLRNFDPQPGTVNKQSPSITLSFRRKETKNPIQLAYDNVGYINSVDFYGFPKETVLCTSIRGESQDGGSNYDVSYEFASNLNTWKAAVVHMDQATNLPNFLATEANGGIKKFDIYKTKDFNALNLVPLNAR